MPEYRMTIMPVPFLRRNRDRVLSKHLQAAADLGWILVSTQVYWVWLGREYHFFWTKG
jgi:hypothetical protein